MILLKLDFLEKKESELEKMHKRHVDMLRANFWFVCRRS